MTCIGASQFKTYPYARLWIPHQVRDDAQWLTIARKVNHRYLHPMRILAGLLITIAAFCFALGITLPLLQMERLFFLTDRPSLITIVAQLFASADYLLAIVVGGVSIVFPAVKMLALSGMLAARDLDRATAHKAGTWLGLLSKWSMLDVLLVAITIFAAKTSGLATAISQPGLWFFAISTLASAVAASIVKKQLTQDAQTPPSKIESGAINN